MNAESRCLQVEGADSGKPMHKHIAKRGSNADPAFWGCTAYAIRKWTRMILKTQDPEFWTQPV